MQLRTRLVKPPVVATRRQPSREQTGITVGQIHREIRRVLQYSDWEIASPKSIREEVNSNLGVDILTIITRDEFTQRIHIEIEKGI